MVTVSATAVGVPFGDRIQMPSFGDTWPTGVVWVLVCLAIGAAMTFVAVRGYGFVARVGHIAAPWMFLVFVACGLVMLAKLGTTNLFEVIEARAGHDRRRSVSGASSASPGSATPRCTSGMSDLCIFRFARKPSYGWASAAGHVPRPLRRLDLRRPAARLLGARPGRRPDQGRATRSDGLGRGRLGRADLRGHRRLDHRQPDDLPRRARLPGHVPEDVALAGTLIAGAVCTVACSPPWR